MKKLKTFEEIDFHSHMANDIDMRKWNDFDIDNKSKTDKYWSIISYKSYISSNNKNIEDLEKRLEKIKKETEEKIEYLKNDTKLRERMIEIAKDIPDDDETFKDTFWSNDEANEIRKKLRV